MLPNSVHAHRSDQQTYHIPTLGTQCSVAAGSVQLEYWLGQPSLKVSVRPASIASFMLLLAASCPPLPWYSPGAGGGSESTGVVSCVSWTPSRTRIEHRPLKTSAPSDAVANGRMKNCSHGRAYHSRKKHLLKGQEDQSLHPSELDRPSARFCTGNQRPCQNDAHKIGTYETRLSSPQHIASAKREGRASMQHADNCAIMECAACCVL